MNFKTLLMLISATAAANSEKDNFCHVSSQSYFSKRVYFAVNLLDVYGLIIDDCDGDNCLGFFPNVAQKAGDMMHVEMDLNYSLEGDALSLPDAVSALSKKHSSDESLKLGTSKALISFYEDAVVRCQDGSILNVSTSMKPVIGL